jgi:PKD repeat protein
MDAYKWDFGDGSSSTGQSPSHTYSSSGTYAVELTVTKGGCSKSSQGKVIVRPSTKPPVQYGQFCEAQKVSGTGVVDMSTSIVDKSIALEYNSAMAGEGDLELDSEHAYSQNADKLKRNLTAVNGSNESSLNLYGSTKLTYSGAVPLVCGEYLHSKEFYGGMGASVQEMFAVNEMEKEQTAFFTSTLPYRPLNNSAEALTGELSQAGRDTAKVDQLMRSREGVYNPSQLVGIDTKAAFNGTWGTDAKWHKILYKDIAAHEMFTGKFEASKLLKFHQYPVPERQHIPCEGIDC